MQEMIVPGFSWALTVAMLAVIWLDASRYVIPNSLNLAILILFAPAAFFLPEIDVLMALAAAGIVLFIGLGMFALGLMGGGDIKLLVVLTLWTGWHIATAQFLVFTAILGGVLVIMLLFLRFLTAALWKPGKKMPPRILTKKQPVPYGLAIAGAFLFLIWSGGIPALS